MQRTESTASMSDNGELVKDFEQGWHCFSTYQLNTDPGPETFISPGDFFSGKKKAFCPHGAFIQVGKDRKYMKERGKTCEMKSYMSKRNARGRARKGRRCRFQF